MGSKEVYSALKEYFGYDSFRHQQEEIISNILSKRDTLVVMPTGGGKSVCFQIPAIVQEGVGVVISPLIALMKDQVEGLRANGVKAACLNSSIGPEEQNKLEKDALDGNLDLLYVSPEKFVSPAFIGLMQQCNVNLIAVDEAHCISQWGHDFRPEYTQLSFIRKTLPGVSIVALTATADKLTRKDIATQLGLTDYNEFISSFDRPNISLSVASGRQRFEQILSFIRARPRQSGIIYCTSRKGTEDLSAKLRGNQIDADHYHAGMTNDERNRVQDDFINDRTDIICATIAFGMGIDKSNVRWVIHYNLPKNIESYYQEIGRAGRDGEPSDALLFYTFADVLTQRQFIEDSAQKDYLMVKLQRMQDLANAEICRRKVLLSYFGEVLEEDCGNCDVCHNPPEQFDGSVIAQKALSAVARLNQSVSTGVLINVLRGARTADILANGYHNIKTYGAGADLKREEWQHYILQLMNMGALEIAYDDHLNLRLTELSKEILFGQKPVSFVRMAEKEFGATYERPKRMTKAERIKNEIFEKLKALRSRLAQHEGIPPYLLFSDSVLREISEKRPVLLRDLSMIQGMTQEKLTKYGDGVLEEVFRFFLVGKDNIGKGETLKLTWVYYHKGMSVKDIAKERGIQELTIYSHLAELYQQGYPVDLNQHVAEQEFLQIAEYFKAKGVPEQLKPVHEFFNGAFPYHKLRLAAALFNKKKKVGQS